LKDLEAKIGEEIEHLKTYAIEAEQKLVVIKTLRDIINDELLNAQVSGNNVRDTAKAAEPSFVQLKTFTAKLGELKTLLSQSHESLYTPLLTTLLSLAETRGFSDSGILRQILDTVGKLEGSLREFRNKQETEGKTNIKNLKGQAQEKVKQIKSLAAILAADISSEKENLAVQEKAKTDLESLDKEIARKKGEVAYWEKICLYQEGIKNKEQEWDREFAGKIGAIKDKLLGLK